MICPHCGVEHPEQLGRFCENCGLAVAPAPERGCPHCGAALAEGGGRFCESCGMSVVSQVRRDDAEAQAAGEGEDLFVRCRFCGNKARKDAGVCPACGNKLPTPDD